MKIIEKLRKFAVVRFYIGMIIAGLLFTAVSGIAIMQPKKDLVKTEAEITSIREIGHDSDGDMQYEVLVQFVDEKNIIHKDMEYTAYSSSMKVGDIVVVEYEKGHPEMINPAGLEWMPYAFGILGIAVIAVGIIFLKKFKEGDYEKDFNQLDRVDYGEAEPEKIAEIKNNDEPVRKYYFHFTGKMNQSYIMETPEREPIYLADCKAFPLLKPYIFDFINYQTGKTTTSEVTHTLTKSVGSARGKTRTSIAINSKFKIDNVDCWDYLAERGYSLNPELDGIRLNFDVLHYGVRVARLTAAGANILRDDKQYKLDIPGNGMYIIECKTSEIEMAFMSAFIVSRVECC